MGSSLPQVRTNEIEESFYGFVVREQFYLTNSCYFEKLEKKLNSIYFFTIIALLITKETASVRSSKWVNKFLIKFGFFQPRYQPPGIWQSSYLQTSSRANNVFRTRSSFSLFTVSTTARSHRYRVTRKDSAPESRQRCDDPVGKHAEQLAFFPS